MTADAVAIALTTTPTAGLARELARALVDCRLAACVQLIPIDSVFRWEGAVEEAQETLLVIKTVTDRFGDVADFVRARHPYDVPELVRLGVAEAAPSYLTWWLDSVGDRPTQ